MSLFEGLIGSSMLWSAAESIANARRPFNYREAAQDLRPDLLEMIADDFERRLREQRQRIYRYGWYEINESDHIRPYNDEYKKTLDGARKGDEPNIGNNFKG